MTMGTRQNVSSVQCGGRPSSILLMTMHLSLLDNLRINHGGMTKACLRRSRALHEQLGIETTILTVNDDPTFPVVLRRVREEPDLGPSKVRNFYCDLADPKIVRKIADLAVDQRTDLAIPELPRRMAEARPDGVYGRVCKTSAEGDLTVYFDRQLRPFLLVESNNVSTGKPLVSVLSRPSVLSRRSSIVYQGPLHILKQLWVDTIIGEGPAILTFDDNRVARTFKDYFRPYVGKIFVQHVSHLEGGEEDNAKGRLRASYRDVFRSLGNFDALVTLTEGQQFDIAERLEPSCRIITIPNVNYSPDPLPSSSRDPRRGVIVTRHASEKRVIHALEAFGIAHDRDPCISLEIVGGPVDSDEYRAVAEFIDAKGLRESVTLVEYDPAAAERFISGGFTVLSSTYEGFGLVLLEAMSRGAVPVSYDVPYGPRGIINDGVDGFLVPNSSVAELAERIVEVADLGADHPMRHNAMSKAMQFSPEAVADRWRCLFVEIEDSFAERNRLLAVEPRLKEFRVSRDGCRVFLHVSGVTERDAVSMRIEAFDTLTHIDTAVSSWRAGEVAEFVLTDESRPEAGAEPLGIWLRIENQQVSTRYRVQWPSSWPQWTVSKTRYGNVNV